MEDKPFKKLDKSMEKYPIGRILKEFLEYAINIDDLNRSTEKTKMYAEAVEEYYSLIEGQDTSLDLDTAIFENNLLMLQLDELEKKIKELEK